jgi:hypothetical protein
MLFYRSCKRTGKQKEHLLKPTPSLRRSPRRKRRLRIQEQIRRRRRELRDRRIRKRLRPELLRRPLKRKKDKEERKRRDRWKSNNSSKSLKLNPLAIEASLPKW